MHYLLPSVNCGHGDTFIPSSLIVSYRAGSVIYEFLLWALGGLGGLITKSLRGAVQCGYKGNELVHSWLL